MQRLLLAFFVTVPCATSLAQGSVVFANRVRSLDSPVLVAGANPEHGPGADWTAQLWLVNPGGTPSPLFPASNFYAATSTAPIRDRYWEAKTVNVPLEPGEVGRFVVRAWLTSLGSYDSAVGTAWGESQPFLATAGGGPFLPANLVSIPSFQVRIVPEPAPRLIAVTMGVLIWCSRFAKGKAA